MPPRSNIIRLPGSDPVWWQSVVRAKLDETSAGTELLYMMKVAHEQRTHLLQNASNEILMQNLVIARDAYRRKVTEGETPWESSVKQNHALLGALLDAYKSSGTPGAKMIGGVYGFIWGKLSQFVSTKQEFNAANAQWLIKQSLKGRRDEILADVTRLGRTDPQFAIAFEKVFPDLPSIRQLDASIILPAFEDAFPKAVHHAKREQGMLLIDRDQLLDDMNGIYADVNGLNKGAREALEFIDKLQADMIRYAQDAERQRLARERVAADLDNWRATIDSARPLVNSIVSLIGKQDPTLGRQLGVAADVSMNVADSVLRVIRESVSPDGVTAAGAMALTGNVVGAVIALATLLGETEPPAEQLILDQLGHVRNDINNLREHLDDRFDRIDKNLGQLYNAVTAGLDSIVIGQWRLERSVNAIASSVMTALRSTSRLEANLQELTITAEERVLKLAVNDAVDRAFWTTKPLTEVKFLEYANLFYSWAFEFASDPIEQPILNRGYLDGDVADELATPLDRNVGYIAQLLSARGWPTVSSAALANPRKWMIASRAYADMQMEWPDHAANLETRSGSNRDDRMIDVGKSLQDAFARITHETVGGQLKANRTLFDRACNDYKAKFAAFLTQLDSIEATFLDERKALFGRPGDISLWTSPPPPAEYPGILVSATTLAYVLADQLRSRDAPAQLRLSLVPSWTNERSESGLKRRWPDWLHHWASLLVTATVYYGEQSVVVRSITGAEEYLGSTDGPGGDKMMEADTSFQVNWNSGQQLKTRFGRESVEAMPTPDEKQAREALFASTQNAAQEQIRSMRQQITEKVADYIDKGGGRSFSGAKAVLQTLVSLGFPSALAQDDYLRGLLYGQDALFDDGAAAEALLRELDSSQLRARRDELAVQAPARVNALRDRIERYLSEIERGTRRESHVLIDTTVETLKFVRDWRRLLVTPELNGRWETLSIDPSLSSVVGLRSTSVPVARPTVIITAQDTLAVFAHGVAGAVRCTQEDANGSWSAWRDCGDVATNWPPSLVRNQSGTVYLFARGAADGALWHTRERASGDWTTPQKVSPSGVVVGTPAAALGDDGQVNVFVIGADGKLWHSWESGAAGGWSTWTLRGGPDLEDPAVICNMNGHLAVFARGTGGALFYMVGLGTSGWTPWRLLGSGGAVTDPPSVVRSPDGVLRVFARGSDGALAHCALTTDGTFTPWSSLYLQCVGTPAAIVDAEDFMSVFVRGVDDHLWHCVETERGVWSRRLVPGGKVQSDPVVAQRTDGRLTVFAAGLDSALWEYAADARHMEPLVPV